VAAGRWRMALRLCALLASPTIARRPAMHRFVARCVENDAMR
jgi:hypothetical protein